MFGGPGIESGAHSTKKVLLKTQESDDFAQRSESNNIIHIGTVYYLETLPGPAVKIRLTR